MKTKLTPLRKIKGDLVWNSIYDSVNYSVSDLVWHTVSNSTLDSFFYPIKHSVWTTLKYSIKEPINEN